MAGLREVVRALLDRPGVEAVAVVSGDGLTIDHAARGSFDAETVAALVPGIVQNARRLGTTAERGEMGLGVLEFDRGLAVLSSLGPESLLLVLVATGSNIGELLHDLRIHRSALQQLG
ncbi:MAG TPA: roadblock/LC7 domain-containing protein [Gemmatimonadales bacterium]|nr:roadblock/LC7 domain-containing protein [Gemmatimonadales bacterium]